MFVLLSVWGLAMLGTAPSFADDGPGRPQATTPVQKAENLIRPAVVYIEGDLSAYVGDNNGFFNDIDQPVKLTYSCTGFVVNPSGYVATAGHVPTSAPREPDATSSSRLCRASPRKTRRSTSNMP